MKSRKPLAAGLLLVGSLALTAPAHAHRTYNVTGFADTVNPLFSLSGLDGFGQPTPSYSGGGGPRPGNVNSLSYYDGTLPVSWMAALHAPANTEGEVFTLSTADALGIGASTPSNFLVAAGGAEFGTGMDFGFIRVDNAQSGNGHGVRITVSADATLGSTLVPYVALYSGWDHSWEGADGTVRDTSGGSTASRAAAFSAGVDNPFGSDLQFIAASDPEAGLSTVSLFFSAPTASHYTVLIGGVGGTAGAYTAIVETAVVPVPAAVWLFGSALAGVVGLRRVRGA